MLSNPNLKRQQPVDFTRMHGLLVHSDFFSWMVPFFFCLSTQKCEQFSISMFFSRWRLTVEVSNFLKSAISMWDSSRFRPQFCCVCYFVYLVSATSSGFFVQCLSPSFLIAPCLVTDRLVIYHI